MLHRPYSGNGTRSSGYCSGTALLGPVGPASVMAANPDLGWNGAGQMSLQPEQVAGVVGQDPRHAVVTLLATVNGQLMELGVPVVASRGGVMVSGEPAWRCLQAQPLSLAGPCLSARPAPARRCAATAQARVRARLLHRHLLRGNVATLTGWPSDPGRDVLCLLTSPPRWFHWL
jgi:hypothetical protein